MDGIGTPHPQPCVQSIWAWLGRWCTILTVAAAEHGQGGRGGPLQSADLKISYRSASPGGCIRLSRLHISNYSPWHTSFWYQKLVPVSWYQKPVSGFLVQISAGTSSQYGIERVLFCYQLQVQNTVCDWPTSPLVCFLLWFMCYTCFNNDDTDACIYIAQNK